MSVGNGSLFSIFLLCRIMDIAYCMAIMLISSNVCLMFILGILNITSILFIEGICDVALALAVMTISGFIFQPLLLMLSINDLYIFCFSGYSIIRYSIRFSFGYVGGRDWYGSPFTHRKSGLKIHLCWRHMQGSSHGGTV